MKIFNWHISLLITPFEITREQRESLAQGTSHIHGNPIRKPLLRIIRDTEQNKTLAGKPGA